MHTFVSSREDMSDRYMKVTPSLLRWTGRVYETFPWGEDLLTWHCLRWPSWTARSSPLSSSH